MRKREVIEPHKSDKRYARRDEQGQFTDSQTNVGRSLAADRRSKSRPWPQRDKATGGTRKRVKVSPSGKNSRARGLARE